MKFYIVFTGFILFLSSCQEFKETGNHFSSYLNQNTEEVFIDSNKYLEKGYLGLEVFRAHTILIKKEYSIENLKEPLRKLDSFYNQTPLSDLVQKNHLQLDQLFEQLTLGEYFSQRLSYEERIRVRNEKKTKGKKSKVQDFLNYYSKKKAETREIEVSEIKFNIPSNLLNNLKKVFAEIENSIILIPKSLKEFFSKDRIKEFEKSLMNPSISIKRDHFFNPKLFNKIYETMKKFISLLKKLAKTFSDPTIKKIEDLENDTSNALNLIYYIKRYLNQGILKHVDIIIAKLNELKTHVQEAKGI